MTQAPMPSLPIERGRPSPGLLAHVQVSKYCDHLPLYRHSDIYARDGLDLPRGLLTGWVGRSAALAEPAAAYIGRDALAGPRVHADDTPMPMVAPGKGRTQTVRFWAYLRDDRPFGGTDPPAVLYEFAPDWKGEHPQRRLRDFQGILQADAYAGFNALSEGGRVVEAACWTHARRYFHDEVVANDSPVAREAIERVQPLFAIEAEIRGQPPEARLAARQARSTPIMAELNGFDPQAYLLILFKRLAGHPIIAWVSSCHGICAPDRDRRPAADHPEGLEARDLARGTGAHQHDTADAAPDDPGGDGLMGRAPVRVRHRRRPHRRARP